MESSTRKRLLGPILLAVFTVMLGLGIIAPLIPGYARTLGANGFILGAIFSVFSLSRTLFTPVTGIFSDRFGRKTFILIGLAAYCLVSLAYIRADTISLLLLVRVLHGLAAALVIPVANAYVGDLAPPGREGVYTGLYLVSFLFGFALGPALGGLLFDRLGIVWCFLTLGFLSFCAFMLTLVFVQEFRAIQSEDPGRVTEKPQALLRSPVVIALLIFTLVSALGRSSIVCFLPLLAEEKLGMSASLLGTVITINLVLAAILQLPFGFLADRMNRKALLLTGTLLSAAMFYAVPLAQGFLSLLIINVLMGLGVALVFPSSQAIAVSLARGRGMGAMLSLLQAATGAGFALGPVLSGVIFKALGIDTVFHACSGFLLIAVFYGLFFLKTAQEAPSPAGSALLWDSPLNRKTNHGNNEKFFRNKKS